MHRHGLSRLSRRVDLSTASASSSTRAQLRAFRSCVVRHKDSESANGPSEARPPKFGNRWSSKTASKSTGLSVAEQSLRDSLVARDRPKPLHQPEPRRRPGDERKAFKERPSWDKRRNPPSRRNLASDFHYANKVADWNCSSCGVRVEYHREKCPSCHSSRAEIDAASKTFRKGRNREPPEQRNRNWNCQGCDNLVFGFRKSCPLCGEPRPPPPPDVERPRVANITGYEGGAKHEPPEQRKGDWRCAECDTLNFGWRQICPTCGELPPPPPDVARPKEARSGDGAKFRKLGRSILSEQTEQLEKEEMDNLRGGRPTETQQETKTEDAESQENTPENDEQTQKQTKDKKDWESALEQLKSLEFQDNQTPTELQKKAKRREGRKQRSDESDEGDFDADDAQRRRKERKRLKTEKAERKKQAESAPAPLYLPEFISVGNLADVIGVRPAQFVRRMEDMGFEDVTYEHVLDAETAGLVAAEFNYEAIFDQGMEDLEAAPPSEDTSDLPSRPPVVTIMGHVDHGKTTILDWLRKSSVAATEHGGITQHIGAFSVAMPSGKTITFLDTPGHSAFLEMRRRGADVTDIVVLVVAADDSVKPQTIEAIKHAMQAKVPIIVAMSKIDKEGCNPDKVKQDLSVHGVHVEDYGGDVQAIPVSGKTGAGMLELEEAIGALSEMLDHRAERDGNAEGWVLEASTKSYGRVASALIRRGTLRPGDVIVAGTTWARVRTLRNEAGISVSEATPGMPVEIDGWRDQPAAGAEILQAETEQRAKDVVEYRLERSETAKMSEDMTAINEARLEKRRREMMEDEEAAAAAAESSGPKGVNFIVKADVDGSAEAVLNSIAAIGNNEVFANVLRSGVGPVSESDIEHAATAKGKIISFNMPIEPNIVRMAELEGVQIMDHNIIYKLIDDVKAILSEQLPPSVTHRVTGEAEIGQVFEITIKGREKTTIAGCRVRNGVINKARKIRVIRGDETIHDGTISSLKNVKKDVTEMRKDTDCGIGFENWTDFAVGDHIQCYEEIFEKRYL